MSQARPPRPITGRMVFFMMVAFFGVVIGVNLIMMQLAIQTLPGTEVDSAYSASLAYEKEIATARAQSARNWKVDAHVQRAADGGATLLVEARDDTGRPRPSKDGAEAAAASREGARILGRAGAGSSRSSARTIAPIPA